MLAVAFVQVYHLLRGDGSEVGLEEPGTEGVCRDRRCVGIFPRFSTHGDLRQPRLERRSVCPTIDLKARTTAREH